MSKEDRVMKRVVSIIWIVCLTVLLIAGNTIAWKNGGYSDIIESPDYGTHDWIAIHSINMLPMNESYYILDYLNYYEYGTELPDNPYGLFDDGFGDQLEHHVYFDQQGQCTDNASAMRAQVMYNLTLSYLQSKDYQNASKYAGAMTHYISDLAVFGHVMGSGTPWGAETHHEDYEDYVQNHQTDFDTYIVFDGTLNQITAYDVAITLAHDITFDNSGAGRNCSWMDEAPTVEPPLEQSGDPTKVRINEMELNPLGSDYGYEWVELYNPTSEDIDLTGCSLTNNDSDVVYLSSTIPACGYFVYTFSSQWLDNVDEKVILKVNNTIVDETPIRADSENDDKSWSRVPNGYDTDVESDWSFITSSEGISNPSSRGGTRAYDWADPAFVARVGESLNLAVNLIADVLHTLAVESGYVAEITDLVVDESSITFTPIDPTTQKMKETNVTNIFITVKNIGNGNATNIKVRAYDKDVAIWNGTILSLPGEGNSDTVHFSWSPLEGTHILRFVVDPDNDIPEIDEDNNYYTISVTIYPPPPVPQPPDDSDQDDLPDSWEIEHFGDLSHSGVQDSDIDGYTNYQEYQAETDPNNSEDYPSDDSDGTPGFELWTILLATAFALMVMSFSRRRLKNSEP